MADSDDDEDYAFYGTPLDPIDEDNLRRKKPIGIEDQIATDRNGRRRFHGAFTGGFSAGFFNSVGSLEGWTPTAFKSSRSNKTLGVSQKPEDFMDDEDREEFGIAPEVLRAKPEYGGNRGTKRNRPTFSDGPIPGEPVLNSIIQPVRETIGVQLLMLMGWKPGQGVGPRLSLLEKKRLALRRKKKTTDSEAASSDSEVEEFWDPEALFAPDDYEARCSRPKVDTQGMGYKGLDRSLLLPSASSSSERFVLFEPTLRLEDNKKKLSIRGQAFGVGAFEDEDEDIYKQDDMRNYDFALETKNSLALKRRQEKAQLAIAHPSDVIEGFVKAKESERRKKYYPGPEVPPGWKPQPRRSRFDVRPGQAIQTNNKLTASERSVIIGESTVDKNRESKEEALKLVEDVKTEASGFRPFETDTDKQDRYEKFLKFVKIGAKDAFCKVQPPTMTDWEKERERNEFEQAARLYTPLSGVIAERFTTGTSSAELEEEKKILSDMEIAAQKKMFGQLTRKVFDWTPCSIVCKRFNIPQPNAEGTLEKTAQEKNKSRMKFSVFDFLDASKKNELSSLQCGRPEEEESLQGAEVVKIKEEPLDKPAPDKSSESAPTPAASQPFDDEVIDLEETGNKMDLFKAIFENSDVDSEEDEETDKPPPETKISSEPLRNTSPPRGIFANLDLDALSNNRGKPKEATATPAPKQPETEPEDPLAYGPKLPQVKFTNVSLPQPKVLTVTVDNSSSSSSSSSDGEEWVEKSHKSKSSKKHSKKSHKKSKKKEKHKRHKKKKKKSK